MKQLFIFVVFILALAACNNQTAKRNSIQLNGDWQITKTDSFDNLPENFESFVPVPGLVDLAVPALDTGRSYENGVYWHKTQFTLDEIPGLVELKLHKAKYRAVVYVNRQFAGEQLYCFTPISFDIKELVNEAGEPNELLIGIGTAPNLPDTVVWGHDFEKLTYIPGIYDDVELVLSDYPFIRNIQIVPQIEEEKVRVVTQLEQKEGEEPVSLSYRIEELSSGNIVAEGKSDGTDFEITIPDCQLWSPESPFLYQLTLSTGADEQTTRFGMRSFQFNPKTKRAELNGETYYMRGTNVCIFRFFEDPDRAELPWDDEWVIKLHQKFKEMNWNSIRYCIGFPPERWYEIADSLGFLIQDEYSYWTLNSDDDIYPEVKGEHIANEFRQWLPERWNHPCVVIWDAQNESITEETGKAIQLVREMDLSNRPWENGWEAPQAASDPYEAHPYLFSRYRRENSEPPSEDGALAELLENDPKPTNDANSHTSKDTTFKNPIIINEYAWLWLNRDGSTTTLTDRVYDVAFGENITKEERIDLYTKNLAMLTEYWRTQRECAGVLHFCGLAYSRSEEPRGQTSDHFIDIDNLTYEPKFVEHVKPAFAPVGLMIDFWDKQVSASEIDEFEVVMINDLNKPWSGILQFSFFSGDDELQQQQKEVTLKPFEKSVIVFEPELSPSSGDYRLEAKITFDGQPVTSSREFTIAQ